MPIENTIDREEKIVYSTCSGRMTEEDFDLYINAIWSDDSHYGFNELFDTVQGDWSEFDFGYLLTIIEAASKLTTIDSNSKLAWLVTDGIAESLTGFYKEAKAMFTTKSRALKTFHSRDEAMAWLKKPGT